MLWLAIFRYAKAVGTGKQGKNVVVAIKQASPRTPRKDNAPGYADARQNVLVILWADGIVCFKQCRRIGRPVCEEVDENQAAKAPFARETDTPSNRGIVLLVIRCRRVQADEHDGRKGWIPDSGEGISVPAAGRKNSGTQHVIWPYVLGGIRRNYGGYPLALGLVKGSLR